MPIDMDLELFETIFNHYKSFLSESKDSQKKLTVEDFNIWLNLTLDNSNSKPKETDIISEGNIDVDISRKLVHLYRYAKMHIKHGMEDFPELTSEDFTYLYMLIRHQNLTMTELIERNIHEKPTGQEVIKRLIFHGLIIDRVDEVDRRIKRLMLTEKGNQLFKLTLDRTRNIAKVITGNLSQNEKKTLLYLIEKLDAFHNPIYLKNRDKSIDEIINVYNLA